MHQAASVADTGDLSRFQEGFFAEAAEHLDLMETLLLRVDFARPDAEDLNAIFRVTHSIKGGAATFGFQEIAGLAHDLETVFDRVRKGEAVFGPESVDAFLSAGDALKEMLACRREGGDGIDEDAFGGVRARLQALHGDAAGAGANAGNGANGAKDRHVLDIAIGPFDAVVTPRLVESVVSDLAGFGELHELPGEPGDAGAPSGRRLRLVTDVAVPDMVNTLGFMLAPESVTVAVVETIPGRSGNGAQPENGAAASDAQARTRPSNGGSSNGVLDANSIRVKVHKVDELVNLVGELVITQAMLAQAASKADSVLAGALANGLAQLEHNTRELQDAAMSMRMMPVAFVFSRFPRLVRDLAGKLGKEVALRTVGEDTELDKGLVERIVDPLTHLVRNSLDHGIEAPEVRAHSGKPRAGTITLCAYHQGGDVVIEVSDDGAGMRRERILAKARERGMPVSDDMSDRDVWRLIFEPGFSTAEAVTEVSGRGVGLDVVRRNVKEMGGRVEVESEPERGTRISIRLPLTLAILDGMSVRAGAETYIVPLTGICESLRPAPGSVRTVSGRGRVLEVRGEYVPVVALSEVFGVAGCVTEFTDGIMVILEADGARTALFVDDLVGQHQVVIKSLEVNYRKVPGISAATIMGDGRVALILDVAHLVGLQRVPSAVV
jgi:two-component system chemotaxis sensor kinase CheA